MRANVERASRGSGSRRIRPVDSIRSSSFDNPDGDSTICAASSTEPEPTAGHVQLHQHVVAWHRQAAVAAHLRLDLVPQPGMGTDQCDPCRCPDLCVRGHGSMVRQLLDMPSVKDYYLSCQVSLDRGARHEHRRVRSRPLLPRRDQGASTRRPSPPCTQATGSCPTVSSSTRQGPQRAAGRSWRCTSRRRAGSSSVTASCCPRCTQGSRADSPRLPTETTVDLDTLIS